MARQRQKEGAESKRGVFGVPCGTIEGVQFCKNGVVRLSRYTSLRSESGKTRGGHRREL